MKNARSTGRALKESGELPFVFMNAASSADGKIALPDRKFAPFGSRFDVEHLYELRATADAVISGARTIGSSPVTMGVGGEKFRRMRVANGLAEHNLRILVSGSGSLSVNAELFKHRFSPIIVLTTSRASKAKMNALSSAADVVRVCGEREIDFDSALRWLGSEWGVKRLLCEGGGELNAALLEKGLVDELHLTICPVLIGGRASPTIADGHWFSTLASAAKLRLVSRKSKGGDLFLVYRVLP